MVIVFIVGNKPRQLTPTIVYDESTYNTRFFFLYTQFHVGGVCEWCKTDATHAAALRTCAWSTECDLERNFAKILTCNFWKQLSCMMSVFTWMPQLVWHWPDTMKTECAAAQSLTHNRKLHK